MHLPAVTILSKNVGRTWSGVPTSSTRLELPERFSTNGQTSILFTESHQVLKHWTQFCPHSPYPEFIDNKFEMQIPESELRASLESHNAEFEALLRLIPARYYLPFEDSSELSDTVPSNKYQKHKKKEPVSKQAIKEASKKAKRNKVCHTTISLLAYIRTHSFSSILQI